MPGIGGATESSPGAMQGGWTVAAMPAQPAEMPLMLLPGALAEGGSIVATAEAPDKDQLDSFLSRSMRRSWTLGASRRALLMLLPLPESRPKKGGSGPRVAVWLPSHCDFASPLSGGGTMPHACRG